ncbi:fasciclin domain-containing protein [Altererythrobacter arenosus]|uniref:Fasciclin domain-containing protein n=1 Tax=Altererythrobacter arenosus TaxID=3032592 RepID=A0ABY8FTD1_9SPHN|nr:fasciclin domain-containing protein [Altererythrobacter sp. CAU 1644]WFL78022.1 fasciclin domain-containing protein [Altererythrobacter sp. CAU 1644]
MTYNTPRAAFAAIGALSLMALSACTDVSSDKANMETQEKVSQTVAALIGEDGKFSTLARELKDSSLSTVLDSQASYTVLAPTNEVFEGLEGGEALLSDDAQGAVVAALLREHMIPGALTPEAIRQAIADNGGPVTVRSFGEDDLKFTLDGDTILVSGPNGTQAHMSGGALIGSNGVVIPLDGLVSAPPSAR